MKEVFRQFAARTSDIVGSAWTFVLALVFIFTWAVTGPLFDFSNTWQLIINTGTTILTFLMVFLIQNTQNRDSKATHLKLDELIKATQSARNKLINLEEMSDEELNQLHEQFQKLRDRVLKNADK